MTGLADPRGEQVDDWSWRADKAMRAGQIAEARELYARAAEIEQAIAIDSLEAPIRVRSVLAVSAVALWYKAGRWPEVEALAYRLLGDAGRFTPDACAELRDLLQRSWVESQMDPEELDSSLPIELRLVGGDVGGGLAPAKAVKKKQEQLVALLERVGEWRLGLEYRESGKNGPDRGLDVLEVPARVAGYGIRLYVRSTMQDAKGKALSTRDLLMAFFELASASPDEIERAVVDTRYRQAFLDGLHDLSADGEQVADVIYSTPTWRLQLPEIHLDAYMHERVGELRTARREPESRAPSPVRLP